VNLGFRSILAGGAIAIGLFLIAFELRQEPPNWFWLALWGLMIILGLVELLTGSDEGPDRRI
jgi:uncharacterized protein (DUF983 family)